MAFISYTNNNDGTYSFTDDTGQSTPPMAGPAAQQQVAKIDAGTQAGVTKFTSSKVEPLPPTVPIRGERASLSPEMLDAGAGPDLRTAELTKAPNGNATDVGGAPQLEKLIASGMTPKEAVDYTKQQAATNENLKAAGDWISNKWHNLTAPAEEKKKQERVAAGLPPEAPKMAKPGETKAFTNSDSAIHPTKVVMSGSAGPRGSSIPIVTTGGATGGPTRRVEMQTGRNVSEQQTVHNDEDIVANKQAGQAQYNAVEEQALADTAANNTIAKEKEDAVNRIQDTAQKQQAREQLRQEETQKRMVELDGLRQQVGAKIDPQQYWADKSEGQKIGAALLMGIGVMTGHNEPMQIFNNAVEKNIDAQKTNIQAARGKLEDAKGAMAEYMKLGASEREAEHLTRSLLLDDASRRIDMLATQTNNPKIKAAAEARKAEIQKQNAEENLKLNQTVVGQTKNYVMGTVGGGGQTPIFADIKKDEWVRGPNGKYYEFSKGESAQKAQESLAAINQNKQDADKLSTIIQNPSYLMDADKRAEANAISRRLAVHAGKAEGSTGKMNEGYFKAVGEAITNGDVNSITNLGRNAALTEYRSGLDTEGMGIIQQHAVSEIQPIYHRDLKKGVEELKFIRSGDAPKQAPDMRGTQVGE